MVAATRIGREIEPILADPFRCRMWIYHDRLDEFLNEESCRLEIGSFQKQGQLSPVLARRIIGDSYYDFELIYGARRLFVARHLNKPLAVFVENLPDRDAIELMDIENRHRKDVSPYERGLSYSKWLRQGLFQSQEDIARSLKISKSQVSRLLKMARLPAALLQAFRSPLDISEAWGVTLADACEDTARREVILSMARKMARGPHKPSSREIYDHLISSSQQRPAVSPSRRQIVRGGHGNPLFYLKHHQHMYVISLPCRSVSQPALTEIRDTIVQILERTDNSKHCL